MGKKKIVIDTNLMISALGWGGKPNELIERVIDKEVELFISINQLKELKRVLDYPKFDFTMEEKRKFIEKIYEISNVVATELRLDIVDDKKDNMILECAVESDTDFIITGDDDLLRIEKFGKIKMVSVKKFLDEY